MQELNITEYAGLPSGVGLEPSLGSHALEYDITPVQSKAINERAGFVRLLSTSNCRFSFGDTVNDNSTILLSGEPEYFAVKGGIKLSVVTL